MSQRAMIDTLCTVGCAGNGLKGIRPQDGSGHLARIDSQLGVVRGGLLLPPGLELIEPGTQHVEVIEQCFSEVEHVLASSGDTSSSSCEPALPVKPQEVSPFREIAADGALLFKGF